jgi:protein-glutamine gamma-glutamyltransferase
MNLVTVFQISIYGLTAMSGAMLAYGEEVPFPSVLTIVLSLVALLFNEWIRKIRIGLWPSNLLGLGALGIALVEFLGESIEARLLSGAHFLVYLTWIVLFQDKRVRQYWWLFALSLLQVAVGAVLTLSGWYGVFLLVYLLLALWTMSVFQLYQGALAFGAEGLDSTLISVGPLDGAAAPAIALATEFAPMGRAVISPAMAFDASRQSRVKDVIQQDAPSRWITPRFVAGVNAIALMGMGLGLVLFLFVPRFWLGSGNPFANRSDSAARALTGFSNQVRLGHLGRHLESNERVLQMRLFNNDSDAPIRLEDFTLQQGLDEPLFRGSALDVYERGRWSNPAGDVRLANMASHPRPDGMVRQEYRLEPLGSGVLFSLRPIDLGAMTDPYDVITYDPETRTLSTRVEARETLSYVIYSQPFVPTGGLSRRPRGRFGDLPEVDRGSRGHDRRAHYLRLVPTGLERLKAMAEEWTAPGSLPAMSGLSEEARKAKALEARLRDSGEYTYSLNMTVIDPATDPVEDFLINRKSGHCEYYASALALMLRAVGIPSRLIMGFKGAEYFKNRDYYEVQQRHAHAWVEAFVDNEWVVLDATPQARDESVRNFAAGSDFWRNARSSLSSLWSTYVVTMSYSRQKESLYDPLKGSMTGGFSSIRDVMQGLRNGAHWLKTQLTSPEELLTGRGVALLAWIFLALLATLFLARRAWWFVFVGRSGRRVGRFASWWTRVASRLFRPRGPMPTRIEVYESFLAIASSRKLCPRVNDTQWEFAATVERNLSKLLHAAGEASLPRDITDFFCRVRFGGVPAEASETAALETRLRQLRRALEEATDSRRDGDRVTEAAECLAG